MKELLLNNIYKNKVIIKMKEFFKYKSIMQVPKINKITINISNKNIFNNKEILKKIVYDLSLISNQLPIVIKSKKSISNFKIREGYPIACKVTLRKFNMWIFLDKFLYISIPRIRDFKGFSKKSFDKNGNYNIGIKEHIIFPEIYFNNSNVITGLDISISISSNSIKESIYLLKALKFPFF